MGHRNSMVTLRSEMAGLPISNRSFYEYFLNSLPHSLDLLVALYDSLCNRFSKYEMRMKPADVRDGKLARHRVVPWHSLVSSHRRRRGKGRRI